MNPQRHAERLHEQQQASETTKHTNIIYHRDEKSNFRSPYNQVSGGIDFNPRQDSDQAREDCHNRRTGQDRSRGSDHSAGHRKLRRQPCLSLIHI